MITKKDFMLCESIKEEELKNLRGEWKANIKYDGERIIIIKFNGDIFVMNRAGRIKNQIYPEVVKMVKDLQNDFILDSEVVTFDEKFNTLQHRSNLLNEDKIQKAVKEMPVKLMVFDLLYYGKDLRNKPLKERVQILKENFEGKLDLVEYGNIQELLSFAKSKQLEGIVIKNMLSNYEGKRSKNWLKLKLFKQAKLRVISYTINDNGIRAEDNKENAVQIAGHNFKAVKDSIDEKGYCDIVIQYLEKTKNNKYRFISYKGLN